MQKQAWLLRVFQRRLVAAARMQNRPGQILNLHTHRYAQSTRNISWTDLPRVYHNAQVVYVSGSRVCSCSSRRLPAIGRILSLHTLPSRQQGTRKVSWTDEGTTRRRFRWLVTDTRNRERHSLRRTNNLHNPIRRPKSTPRNYAPECFTQLRTESAAESPGDQSGPNKQSGLTQCDLQQKADSDSSSSPRRRCVCSPQHSTTAESAVAAGLHSHTVEAL